MLVQSSPGRFSSAQVREAIAIALEGLKTQRPVRKVVTPTGRRVRGIFPSLKSPGRRANFESGLEELMLCICEVAGSVRRLQTHPYVLRLSEPPLYYTPDVEIETDVGLGVLEAKGNIYLRTAEQKERYRRIHRALADLRIPFGLILSTDVSKTPLESEVRALLRNRPQPRHGARGFVPGAIPGLEEGACSSSFVDRWVAAGKECDALLARLMRRGPDDTICAAAL